MEGIAILDQAHALNDPGPYQTQAGISPLEDRALPAARPMKRPFDPETGKAAFNLSQQRILRLLDRKHFEIMKIAEQPALRTGTA